MCKQNFIFILIILFLLVVGLISFFLTPWLIGKIFTLSLDFSVNNTALGIVLGVVATIVGILVPLHYSIVLDIIGKIKNNENIDSKNKNWLLYYIATSDIVIHLTALFGAFSLIEGAYVIAFQFKLLDFSSIASKSVGYIYIIMVTVSILRSLCVTKNEWPSKNKKQWRPFIIYFLSICFIFILSIVWGRALIFLNIPKIIIVITIFVLSIFYLYWNLLKIPFIPVSRVLKISV